MKRRRFEDRLERELLAAARRQAEETGAVPQRGRLRVAVGVVAAVTALGALTLAVVLSRPQGEAPRQAATEPAAPARPLGCKDVVLPNRLELTTRTMPRYVYDAIAVLRRPQTATEREVCTGVAAAPRARVNPDEVRYAGLFSKQAYGRLFVATRWFGDEPQICIQRIPYGVGTGGCQDATTTVARGYAYAYGVSGLSVYHFVVPDGVAEVELRRSDGRATRLPVRDNVAWLVGRRAFSKARTLRLEYDLLDAEGAVLSTAPVVTSTS